MPSVERLTWPLRLRHIQSALVALACWRPFMWHKKPKAVSALALAIVNEAQTPCQFGPHRPLLPEWT